MPSRPIAEYYGHLGPTDTYSLDSSWHGKTPLDSSVQNEIVPFEMKTTLGGSHVTKGHGSTRYNGDGLSYPTINQVIAVHPFTKSRLVFVKAFTATERSGSGAGDGAGILGDNGTTGPRWE